MLKLVVLVCTVVAAYSSVCGPSDFEAFEGCMNETLPHKGPEDFKACFTSNNCPVPDWKPKNGSSEEDGQEEHSRDEHHSGNGSHSFSRSHSFGSGWGKGKGKGGEHSESMSMFSGKVNGTVFRQCVDELRKTVTDDIKSCVQQKYNPSFDFPKFKGGIHKEGGMHKGGFGKGGFGKGSFGKGKGKGHGHDGFNKTQCPNGEAVKTCIEGLFNHSAVCVAIDKCKAKASCSRNETEAAVCACANSTVEANGAKYEDTFFKCIGQDKPADSKMFQVMKAKAAHEFCRPHDEMEMCNGGGKGKGKGKGWGSGRGRGGEDGGERLTEGGRPSFAAHRASHH